MRGAYGEATDVVALLRRPTRAATVRERQWLSDELVCGDGHGIIRPGACRSQPLRRHCRLRPARMGLFSAEIASF